MSQILIKRLSVSNKIPLITDLVLGELSINTFGGVLFLKKNNGTDSIVTIGAGVASGGTTGQVLTKLSNANYDTTWTTISTGASDSFNPFLLAGM
jgi:hypothetical protein